MLNAPHKLGKGDRDTLITHIKKAETKIPTTKSSRNFDGTNHLINKEEIYQVSTSFLNDEEQNKVQMASLGQELGNLRTELREHRVNALEGNQESIDPNQKGSQNATRFCGYCRSNGHTPSFCRKNMRDEEIKKLQIEATAEKKVTFTQV